MSRSGLALLRLELRQQWRYGVVALAAALTAAWTGLVLVVPGSAAPTVAAWLLMLETAVLGTTLAGALVLHDRGNGVLAALATSPARLGEYLTARIAVLTALVLAATVPVAIAGRLGLPAALAATGLVAVLTMLVAVAVAVRSRSGIGYIAGLPLVLLPLILPALVHGAGLSHPALWAAPTTGAITLLLPGGPGIGEAAAMIGWLVVAAAVAGVVARGQLRRYASTGPPSRRQAGRPRRGYGAARAGPVIGFLRGDLAGIGRDPLLSVIVASPLLLGLTLRFGYPPVRDWLDSAYGFDLDPYRPVLLAVACLLHVPVSFGMVGALLVLDDLDDRALLALRTSPLTLPRYLGYRAGLVAVAALAGLGLAVPLSGLAPVLAWQQWPALLPAALLAPAITLATVALAGNKVAGVAVLKLLGLPIYAPLAAWWLTGPAAAALALLPPWWALRALWTGWPYAVVGTLVTGLLVGLLARPALTRLGATTLSS